MLKKLTFICCWMSLCVFLNVGYATDSTGLAPPTGTINKFHYFYTSDIRLESGTGDNTDKNSYPPAFLQLAGRYCSGDRGYDIAFVHGLPNDQSQNPPTMLNNASTLPVPFDGYYKITYTVKVAPFVDTLEIQLGSRKGPVSGSTEDIQTKTTAYLEGKTRVKYLRYESPAGGIMLNKGDVVRVRICLNTSDDSKAQVLLTGGEITIESL